MSSASRGGGGTFVLQLFGKASPVVRSLKRVRIQHRIASLILIMTAGIAALVAVVLVNLANTIYAERADQTHHLVESAASLVQHYQELAAAGDMTVENAQHEVLERLRALRYDEGQYFWVNDLNGKMLMHPTAPDLVGTDVRGLRDARGTAFFADMIETVNRSQGAHYDYFWPADATAQLKRTYVMRLPKWDWMIGSGVFMEAADDAVRSLSLGMLAIAGIILAVASACSFLVGRTLTKPISALSTTMGALSKGQLDVVVPGVGRSDELGEMAQAVQVFKENAIERRRMEAQQAAEREKEVARAQRLEELTGTFDKDVAAVLAALGGSADEMQQASQTMSATAEETSRQATAVAAASEQASSNVQTVASAAEELSSSIREIARQMGARTPSPGRQPATRRRPRRRCAAWPLRRRRSARSSS